MTSKGNWLLRKIESDIELMEKQLKLNNRSKKRFKNRIGEYATDFTKLYSAEKKWNFTV